MLISLMCRLNPYLRIFLSYKDSEHQGALDLKTEGNQYFKEEKYELAASCYTQALKLFTPEEKDKGKLKDRGVILKNRAACYLKLVSIIHAVLMDLVFIIYILRFLLIKVNIRVGKIADPVFFL